MSDCIFCKIVSGDIPSYTVWESDTHKGFLSIFPNTEGFTVVIPKEHFASYFVEIPENVLVELMKAARQVALLLDQKLDDVGRTALMFEGFGVDHIHAKLFPMHGTKGEVHIQEAENPTFFKKYEGYISSHNGQRARAEDLERVAKKIRE